MNLYIVYNFGMKRIWKVKSINKKHFLIVRKKVFKCQLGEIGSILPSKKIEGDNATPKGRWCFNSIYFRNDRVLRPKLKKQLRFKLKKISKNCGWCDDIKSHYYNKHINIKNFALDNTSFEKLWRDDTAYDIFITLDYNKKPTIYNKGSAIFVHCSFEDNRNTSGCIALPKRNLIELIKNLKKNTFIII